MSDTFKFLKQQAQGPTDQPFAPAGQSGPDAAQDFLAKQMAKNKFLDTGQPVENVGKHQTTDPYAFGEGTVPGGEGYEDQRVVKNQKEIDAWHKANPDGPTTRAAAYAPTGTEGYVHNYKASGDAKEGKSSKGKKIEDFFQGEELNALRDYTAGLGKDPYAYGFADKDTRDLTKRGEMEGKLQKIGKHLGYNNNNLNTGHIRDFVMRGEEPQVEVDGPPKPEYEMKPIEHSAEIRQAKERVKTYDENVKSGKLSQEINGNASFEGTISPDQSSREAISGNEQKSSDQYVFDASKGMNAIGSDQFSVSAQGTSAAAAQSFLDNKTSQVKKNLSPV